jgi:hypothetical protein
MEGESSQTKQGEDMCQSEPPDLKTWRYFILLAGPVAAALWLICFYTYCWRAHGYFGHWPTSMGDHFAAASVFPRHKALTMLWFDLVFYLPFFWIAGAFPLALARVLRWREFLAGLACWAPFLLAFIIDPGGLIWSFID